MTEFSKKFLAKSPLRGGILALGRVLMSPRANTSRFLGDTSGSLNPKKSYSYGIKQAIKDVKSGKLTKKEAIKQYKQSLLEGPQYYL
tara:strand:+ start:1160 stop:1420 length:261 start_codon:yes stop_codon:yes gene_type:complete